MPGPIISKTRRIAAHAHGRARAAAPSSQQLAARFRPIFHRIAVHAAQRENERELAYEPVAWLNAERFGALRVPAEYGGSARRSSSCTTCSSSSAKPTPTCRRSCARTSASSSGCSRRSTRAARPVDAAGGRRRDLRQRHHRTRRRRAGAMQTTLSRDGDAWRLDGDKYYSTGTLYADWISVSAQRLNADGSSDRVIALVPSEAEGVERVDDWRGFGQRLSASGTTRFRNVRVKAENVLLYVRDQPTPLTAHFQLTHLATLAGIARAIVRDAVAFVQPRKRVYSHGSGDTPREDPLVQQVIGQLASTAFIAASTVQAVARGLGEVDRFRQRGETVPESLLFEVELNTAKAQAGIVDAVLQAGTRLFDIGGASALQEDRRLDRHWRNARTLASHNPTIYKGRVVGDHLLNGARPRPTLKTTWAVGALKVTGLPTEPYFSCADCWPFFPSPSPHARRPQ
jgi:alkylation response protein AidB-like acyl-CoA dehydrogenase